MVKFCVPWIPFFVIDCSFDSNGRKTGLDRLGSDDLVWIDWARILVFNGKQCQDKAGGERER